MADPTRPPPLTQKNPNAPPAPEPADRDEETVKKEQTQTPRVRITNTEQRIHGIGKSVAAGATGVAIGTHFDLQPGLNMVPADLWEEAKKHKMVQHHIEEGHFVEEDNRPLKTMEVVDALALVKKTFKLELLESFKRNDKRPKVQAAIDAQVKVLKETKPKGSGEEQGE